MTDERLLNLLLHHLTRATHDDLEMFSSQLHTAARPKMEGMRPMDRQSCQRALEQEIDNHAVDLVLAYLRKAPARPPDPQPESRLKRLFPQPDREESYND
jgi:hypothetical protein